MRFALSVACLLLLLSNACGQDDEGPMPIAAYHNRCENCVAPDDWASVWPMCGGRSNQSPIDLAVDPTYKHFSREDYPLILEINSSCQMMYDTDTGEQDTSPKWAFTDDDCYAYGQNEVPHKIFHSDIHTPAEHTLNGVRYDAEFHIGWQYRAPNNATLPNVLVIGFLFQGDSNAEEHPFLANLIDIQQNDNITKENPVDLGEDWTSTLGLRSNTTQHDVTFMNYFGSGDIPPCLGGIDWWIVDTPIMVAQSQIVAIHEIIKAMPKSDNGDNVRPIQSLGDREIRTGDYAMEQGNMGNNNVENDQDEPGYGDGNSASFAKRMSEVLAVGLLNTLLLL